MQQTRTGINRWGFYSLLLALFVITSIFVSTFCNTPTVNATKYSEMSVNDAVRSWLYYRAVSKCADGRPPTSRYSINNTQALYGSWFGYSLASMRTVSINYPIYGLNPMVATAITSVEKPDSFDCYTGAYTNSNYHQNWIYDAINIWGYKNGVEAVCSFGLTRENDGDCIKDTSDTLGNYKYEEGSTFFNLFELQSSIKAKVYDIDASTEPNKEPVDLVASGAGADVRTKAEKYLLYREAFENGCGGGYKDSRSAIPSSAHGKWGPIGWVDDSGVITSRYYYSNSVSNSSRINFYIKKDLSPGGKTCDELANVLGMSGDMTFVSAYVTWAPTHGGQKPTTPIPPKKDSPETATSCAIEGIGWIVCPVLKFMAWIADASFKFLERNFLATEVSMLDTSSAAYSAWSTMRNIANVAFVIAFLIIIFSQLTGGFLDNYGIKKLLPKIIIAAILVNISFFICQLAVDISNIIGGSLDDLLKGIAVTAPNSNFSYASAGSGGFADIVVGAVGVTAAGTVAYLNIAALVPVIIAAVVALVMILLILTARQAIIILLIVIAPLAFVAYLLPNTEKWYKQWQKTFVAMLVLYPIIALVFGASTLASRIISSTSFGGGNTGDGMGQIIGAAVLVLPLFVVPSLLKKALDGVGNIGATLNGLSAKLGTGAANKWKGSRLNQHWEGERKKNTALVQGGTYEGKSSFRRALSKGYGKFNAWDRSGKFGERAASTGVALADEIEKKDVENEIILMKSKGTPATHTTDAVEALGDAIKSGDKVKAMAAQKIALESGAYGMGKVKEKLMTLEKTHGRQQPKVFNALKGGLVVGGAKENDPSMFNWAVRKPIGPEGAKITHDSLEGYTEDKNSYFGLAAEEFVKLSDDTIKQANKVGGVNPDTLAQIKANDQLIKGLSSEARKELGISQTDSPGIILP